MTTDKSTPRRRMGSFLHGHWKSGLKSLHFKASVIVVLAVVLLGAVGVAVSTRTMSMVLYDTEYSRTLKWAHSLAAGTSGAVESQDRASLAQIADDLVHTRAVSFAGFSDPSGRLIAAAEAQPGLKRWMIDSDGGLLDLAPMHSPELVYYRGLDLACAEVVVPVYSTTPLANHTPTSRPIAGYLRFAVDVTETRRQLERVSAHLTRVGLGLVLLVIPCSLLVTRRVVAPLNELAKTAMAIANGSTDARAGVHSDSEIGVLARSFNTMADRLTTSQLELLQLNAELEKRVQERTRELQELAARDPLTGLYNRRYFSEVINREFAAAERYDADLTCLMFDLDRFKQINDQHGHRAGDEVLAIISRAIASELRGSDVAARFGGDEFIALLPQTSASSASMLVDRVVARFEEDLHRSLPDVDGGVSVGVASLRTTQAASAEILIHEADLALYAAKEARRNSHTLAPQATTSAAR